MDEVFDKNLTGCGFRETKKKKEKFSEKMFRYLKKKLWDSWQCPGWFKCFQHVVGLFICDPFADLYITICIVLNTLCLAIDYHGASEQFKQSLKNANLVPVLPVHLFHMCSCSRPRSSSRSRSAPNAS